MSPESPPHVEKKPTASVAYDRAINYAFQQNAIPVVKELRLQNDATARKDLTIRVTTEPAFAEPLEGKRPSECHVAVGAEGE